MRRMGWVGFLLACTFAIPAQAEQAAPVAPEAMKPALLVIDVQKDFLPFMAEQDKRIAPLTINGAIWLFRTHEFPVIRVYHTDPNWGPAPDSDGFQFHEGIQVTPEDPQVVKNHPSAFQKTKLEQLLRERGVNAVFLCGLSATGCVLATYYGAIERDFATFMVRGGLISPNSDQTETVETFTEGISFEALKAMLDSARLAADGGKQG